MRRLLHILSDIVLVHLLMLSALTTTADAHPGSGIAVDALGQIYFADTGQGVWKLDTHGRLTLISRTAYHFMAIDVEGRFAKSHALGDFDRGSFERITPFGASPALIISSDFPIAVGGDGWLYYVPYNPKGPRDLVRRAPDGQRTVWARLPINSGEEEMLWVNGIAAGPGKSLYATDDTRIYKIERDGRVSTLRNGIKVGGAPIRLQRRRNSPIFAAWLLSGKEQSTLPPAVAALSLPFRKKGLSELSCGQNPPGLPRP